MYNHHPTDKSSWLPVTSSLGSNSIKPEELPSVSKHIKTSTWTPLSLRLSFPLWKSQPQSQLLCGLSQFAQEVIGIYRSTYTVYCLLNLLIVEIKKQKEMYNESISTYDLDSVINS